MYLKHHDLNGTVLRNGQNYVNYPGRNNTIAIRRSIVIYHVALSNEPGGEGSEFFITMTRFDFIPVLPLFSVSVSDPPCKLGYRQTRRKRRVFVWIHANTTASLQGASPSPLLAITERLNPQLK